MKWCTVLVACRHAGQISDGILLIWVRYLANGMCPVLSCMMMLAPFLGSIDMILMKLAEVAWGSVSPISMKCGDNIHSSCASLLVLALNAYLTVELLEGSDVVSIKGSLFELELPLVMAFLARESAFVLPSTPSCAGTCLSWMDIPGSFFLISAMALWNASSR